MNKTYVIQWKSKVNGRAGTGTKLFQFEDGQRLVEELNLEYPQIEHHLVENQSEAAAPEPPSATPQAHPQSEPEEIPEPEYPHPVGTH